MSRFQINHNSCQFQNWWGVDRHHSNTIHVGASTETATESWLGLGELRRLVGRRMKGEREINPWERGFTSSKKKSADQINWNPITFQFNCTGLEDSYRGNCMVDCTSTKNCCTLCLSYAMARSAIKRTPKIQVVKPISHNTSQKRKYQLLFRSSRNLFVWKKKSSFLAFRLAFMPRDKWKIQKSPPQTSCHSPRYCS